MSSTTKIIRLVIDHLRQVAFFYWRRFIVALVNVLVGPPNFFPMQNIRRCLLRAIGARIKGPSQVSEELYVLNGFNLAIDSGARLGSFCRIWDFSKVSIGKNLLASHNLTIVAGTHDAVDLSPRSGPVEIGDDVWIGANVTIIGPVKIGSRSILGAGAVVLRDVPSDAVFGGVPAKLLKMRGN